MKKAKHLHQFRWRIRTEIGEELDRIRRSGKLGTWDEFFEEVINQHRASQEGIPSIHQTLNSILETVKNLKKEFTQINETIEVVITELTQLATQVEEVHSELAILKDLITLAFENSTEGETKVQPHPPSKVDLFLKQHGL